MSDPPEALLVRRRARRRRAGVAARLVLLRAVIVVGLLAVVEVVERSGVLPPTFVARPTRVWGRLVDLVATGNFLSAMGVTAATVLLSLLLAGSLGLFAGYVLWRSRMAHDALVPGVAALFSSPIILLYPIPLVIFGRTAAAVVALAVVFGGLPIVLYTVRAFSEVRPVLLRVGEVSCLGRWRQLRWIVLPAAAPTMFTGLRLGATYVLIAVISMEFLVQLGGLGQQIQVSALRFDTAGVYAYIGGVVLLVVAVVSTLQTIEQRLQR